MQFRQKQALEAFGRVMDFLAAIPVPPPGTYGEAKATLEEVVARLSDHSTVQVSGKRAVKANMSPARFVTWATSQRAQAA